MQFLIEGTGLHDEKGQTTSLKRSGKSSISSQHFYYLPFLVCLSFWSTLTACRKSLHIASFLVLALEHIYIHKDTNWRRREREEGGGGEEFSW